MSIYLLTRLPTYQPTHRPNCKPSYLPACLPTCMGIYMPTLLRAYLPAYQLIYMAAFLSTSLPSYLSTCLFSNLRIYLPSYLCMHHPFSCMFLSVRAASSLRRGARSPAPPALTNSVELFARTVKALPKTSQTFHKKQPIIFAHCTAIRRVFH